MTALTVAALVAAVTFAGEWHARCAYGQPGIAGHAARAIARVCRRGRP
jgi:hypothetical protein